MKIGDKVRVKIDLETRKSYGGTYFTENMKKYENKEGVIEDIQYGTRWNFLTLSIDNRIYSWDEEMLELIEEEKNMFKIIDLTTDKTFNPVVANGFNGHLYLIAKDNKTKKICYINLRNGMKFDTEYTTIEAFLTGNRCDRLDAELTIK